MAHDLAIKSLKLNLIPNNIFQIKDEDKLETKGLVRKSEIPLVLLQDLIKAQRYIIHFLNWDLVL